ncbi:MAG TPA: response regulator [Xanthobacteraceae bacterium]|jgi:CheY-like chemotaxis protein|nr:response regulator [Xanthobacteraceae bacterium]
MATKELRHNPERRQMPDWRHDGKTELQRKLAMLRVLIVEDSAFARNMIRGLLTGIGIHVIAEAADGFAALQTMQNFQPEIILLDLEMPNLNGLQFVRRLRERNDYFKLAARILVLTAHADRDRVLFAKNNGIGGFVAKPISTNVLRGHVVSIMRKTQSLEKLVPVRGKPLPAKQLLTEELSLQELPAEEAPSLVMLD